LGATTYDKLNAFMSWCLPSLDGDIKTLEIILTRNKNVIALASSRKNQKNLNMENNTETTQKTFNNTKGKEGFMLCNFQIHPKLIN